MRIGLFNRQQPFAEYDVQSHKWRIWYIFNNNVTSGTYYELASDGTCDRVTVLSGDLVDCVRICDGSPVDVEEQAREFEYVIGASL